MKKMQFVFMLLASLSTAVSCSESEISSDLTNANIKDEIGKVIVIEASQEVYNSDTRTILQPDGSVYWNPGDEISVFFINGENGGNKFTSLNKETSAIAEFSGTLYGITGGGEDLDNDANFWAVYPYSDENFCDGESVTTTLPNKQQAVEDSFVDDLFITVARSENVKMAFMNVCGGIKFCVTQNDIESITFRGNNSEVLAGKVRIAFDENDKPIVTEIVNGETEVTIYAPNGRVFEPGKFYYMILLPTTLESGFTLTFNKTNDTCIIYNRTSLATIKRSIFSVAQDLDTGEAVPKDETTITGGSESGFYLGIIGFNNGLYPYPIKHLSEDSAQGYYSFIDGLTTVNGTWLYYAVDKSIDNLQAATFPNNLYDVAVVTFTDGLDRGSLDMSNYLSLTEYLSALNTRLIAETVSGQKISAYTIGVKGNDVTNEASYENNLKKLATSSDNVFNVKNMSEVNDAFLKIANLLGETKYVQKFMLEIAGPSHNEKCRFTFDNVSSYNSSKQYIEGTFNRLNRTLNDIKYVGLTSTSGSVVSGVRNENNFYVFTFEGLQSLDGKKVPSEYVRHWYTEEGIWQKDSEFEFDPGTVGIEKIKRSAAIMLNLDCSSSLEGNSFVTLQKSAKAFIGKLVENAVDPNEVISISLDKSAVSLPVGSTTTLKATVLPTTALLKDVEWSSTNSTVATVNSNGVISAHSPGNTTIIAKTVDGGYTATCHITVVTLVTEIVLNHTLLELYTGESSTLTATVLPKNASVKDVIWESSNTSVATIDNSGNITPITAGTTTITAIAKDSSGKKATCTITVLQHAESVTMNYETLTLNVGTTEQLTAIVNPVDASNKIVTWESSNDNIVSVDQKGLIHALAKGNAQITATSEDCGKRAVCKIEVKQFVKSIVLNHTTATLNVDESVKLEATINPDDADNKSVLWQSSNSLIASVNQEGLVRAIAPGTVTISVTAQDGSDVAAKSVITVKQSVSSISLNSSSLNLGIGDIGSLVVTMTPNNASNTNFMVTSSNTSVATVTRSGQSVIVTTVGLGSSTITVTSEDGGHKATCDVVVSPSTTPTNLALAVKKGGVRYFIPLSAYSGTVPAGYTKEGLTISSGHTTFVLAFNNATSSTKKFTEAITLGTLPSQTQANVIVQYWSSINSALVTYGGTSLGSLTYWTSTPRGNGTLGYIYSSSGVTSASSSNNTYYVRCITATL